MKTLTKNRGMDERRKTASIALAGPAREKALQRFRAQVKKWRLVMPSNEPLVSDFGLNDFDRTGLIEFWLANETAAGYCGKFLFVFDGQTCPLHRHKQKHETFFIVRGKVKMTIGGSARILREGDCLAVPPGRKHSFTGDGPALLLEVSMPCVVDDNYFENRDIPLGGNQRKRPAKPTAE